MIGIVVVGYADFAEAMIRAAQISKNRPVDSIVAASIQKSSDPEIIQENRQILFSAITKVDQGFGVLVLTDSLEEDGGMIAPSLSSETIVEIVSGVNLPMLNEAVTHQSSKQLTAVAETVMEKGRISITHHTTGPVG